jgi:hypothetical protein
MASVESVGKPHAAASNFMRGSKTWKAGSCSQAPITKAFTTWPCTDSHRSIRLPSNKRKLERKPAIMPLRDTRKLPVMARLRTDGRRMAGR